MNNMLTLEEVKAFLDIEHSELERFIKTGKLHAYKIGGEYLRFRKEEVLNLRYERPRKEKPPKASALSRIGDFWRFNNFYIVSLLIVIVIALIAVRT
jgi:excisionase family DNA binding protein